MEHLHDETFIEAPVEHVWAFYCDTSHWPDWQQFGECSDFTGPVDQVGTTYVGISRFAGFEMKATYKVVEIEPPRLYHEQSDYGHMDSFVRLQPEGEGTRLTFDSDYEMPAHLPGFLKNLMTTHWMERQMHHMLLNFKALAEATVPVPA